MKKKFIIKDARRLLAEQINSSQIVEGKNMNIETMSKMKGLSEVIARYMRLDRLLPEFKDAVDKGILAMVAAVDLSYLNVKMQKLIELWGMNIRTDVEAKKNFMQQTVK